MADATPSMAGTLTAFILSIAHEYGRVRKWSLTTTGLRAVKDANFFVKMAKGSAGFTPERYDRAIRYFIDNWPAGAVWPARPPWPYGRPATGEVVNGKTEETGSTPARASGPKAKAGTAKKGTGSGTKPQRNGAQPKRRRREGELPTAS